MYTIILILIIIFLFIVCICFYKQITNLKQKITELDHSQNVVEKSFLNTVFEPAMELYLKYNFILYFAFSIVFFLTASINIPSLTFGNHTIESHTIQNIFTTIGTVILSSGVFSSITKSKHFLSIFSNEIKKIVYTEEFISKQKNIDEIWNKVTKALCSENFHHIGDTLFNTIKKTYLPINHNFYYQDFNLELFINFAESGIDYVTIDEKTEVSLICENTEKIIYKYSSNIDFDEHAQDSTTFSVVKFSVNGVDRITDLNEDVQHENSILKANMSIELSGSREYKISRIERKQYCLVLNSNRVHSAVKIYNNFKLSVFYPKNLKVKFAKLGINNNWNNVEISSINETTNFLKTNHDGIFFQNQGYMLNFVRIKE